MDLEFHIKAKVLHLSWYSSIIKTLGMMLNIRCTLQYLYVTATGIFLPNQFVAK